MKNNRYFIKSGLGSMLAALLVLAGCASKTPVPVYDRGGQQATAPAASRDSYTVKPGDTLLSIAREHGMDHRELAAMNGIDNPNRISVGRVLKVKPQAAASSAVVTAPVTSEVVVGRPIGSEAVGERAPVAGSGSFLKREPKAGKETYSDQALAQAQGAAQAKVSEVPAAAPEVKAEAKPPVPAPAAEVSPWTWPSSGKVIGSFGSNGNKGIDISGKLGDPVVAAEAGKVILANNTLRGYGNIVVIKHSSTLISVYAHNSKLLVKEEQSVTRGQKISEMGDSDTDQVKLHFEVRLQGKPVDPLKYLPQR